MRDIGIEDAIKYVEVVKKLVDSNWLSEELRKIQSYNPPKDMKKLRKLTFIEYAQQYHPLAFLIHQAENNLQSVRTDSRTNISQETVRLSHLGDDLSVLIEGNTRGLEDKIRDLTSPGKELFDKTVYEIDVGAKYAGEGHSVEFVKTASEKGEQKPDLLIDNEVEVECKKKDVITSRDRRNQALWNLIVRKASGIMDHARVNYAIVVKTQRDVGQEDVEYIVQKLRELIPKKKQGRFSFPDKGIGITLQFMSRLDEVIRSDGMQTGTSEELDHLVVAMEKKGGEPLIRNPRVFGFKCAILSDRVKSVVESLKDARHQLSGTRAGIIYVNLNTIDRRMIDSDFNRLDHLISGVLRNNSTISAAVITTEFFVSDEQGVVYSHKARVIRNDSARFPAQSRIIGEA